MDSLQNNTWNFNSFIDTTQFYTQGQADKRFFAAVLNQLESMMQTDESVLHLNIWICAVNIRLQVVSTTYIL